MIILTSRTDHTAHAVVPGDMFRLTIKSENFEDVVISEDITEAKVINFYASYRFALEDGTCVGFHLCGIFANKKSLPKEILEAKTIEDLTPSQRENFIRSCGVKIKEGMIRE